MSFDTVYPNRKDRRKQYRDSRRFDRSCRHGGDCPACIGNRTFGRRKIEQAAEQALDEWKKGL